MIAETLTERTRRLLREDSASVTFQVSRSALETLVRDSETLAAERLGLSLTNRTGYRCCPFCGEVENLGWASSKCSTFCNSCGASGPRYDFHVKAAWNDRAIIAGTWTIHSTTPYFAAPSPSSPSRAGGESEA